MTQDLESVALTLAPASTLMPGRMPCFECCRVHQRRHHAGRDNPSEEHRRRAVRPTRGEEHFAVSAPALLARLDAQRIEALRQSGNGFVGCENHLPIGDEQKKAPRWLIFRDGCPGGEAPEQVGARVDRVIARIGKVEGTVALFAHGHVLRVLAARWIGLPAGAGEHFLLDTGSLCMLSHYRDIPALKVWNSFLFG